MSGAGDGPAGGVGEGWHDDPNGRHQHRYHDGTGWTDHVADDGVAAIDPYQPPLAPPVPGPGAQPVRGVSVTATAPTESGAAWEPHTSEPGPWIPGADHGAALPGPASGVAAAGGRAPLEAASAAGTPAVVPFHGDPASTWPLSRRAETLRAGGATDGTGWGHETTSPPGPTLTGGVTWGGAVRRCLQRYADFSGRAPRSEYWWFSLTVVLGYLVLGAFGEALSTLFALAIVLPNLAVGARRLHDTGRSGWWQLIGLVPLVGAIVLIVWFATAGERRPNAYGPPVSS